MMGKIGKTVFKHFAEFECPRQIFLDLGIGDPDWMSPLRAIDKGEARRAGGMSIVDLGKAYERSVYAVFQRNKNARARESENIEDGLRPITLTIAQLKTYRDELTGDSAPPALFLLEHDWDTSHSFVRFLFDLPIGSSVPIKEPLGPLRPDVVVLRKAAATAAHEILPDGRIRALPAAEAAGRIAIEILDIKHTHEQGVGSTHFIEIHYYALALSAYLREQKLEGDFFVSLDGHGILPRRESFEIAELRYGEPAALSVPLSWRDTAHIFESARRQLIALQRNTPVRVEDVEARIQRACGHCSYLPDCITSLKHGTDPKDWDVALLPFLRQGIAEQLRARGFSSIGEVSEGIRTLQPGMTPTPVDAEIPALELKARALVAGKILPASPENTAGERLLSIALPRYTDAELYFDLETDPTNEAVFATGLLWSVSVAPTAGHRAAHDVWWRFWRDYLDGARQQKSAGKRNTPPVDTGALEALLDPQVVADTRLDEAGRQAFFHDFGQALLALDATPGSTLEISDQPRAKRKVESASEGEEPEPEVVPGVARPFHVQWRFTYVNAGSRVGGGYRDGERVLAERLVEGVAYVVQLSSAYEAFVAMPVPGVDREGKPTFWFQRPSFAVFHWSREQVDHIEELLERHLTHLLTGPQSAHFLALLDWVAPRSSGVVNALQHLKVFDLREFVESSLGHPEIINVTWHGIDKRLDATGQRGYSRRYWAPHFNYMDFAAWHEYLGEPDANRQGELFQKLITQVGRKLWALQRILRATRREVGDGIARSHLRPVRTDAMASAVLPSKSHPLAVMWMMFSRLSGAVQILDGQYTRSTYPLQSIARLAAAEASEVTWDEATKRFSFSVRGLSANVNMKDGDYALLMPETYRDSAAGANCGVILDRMTWDATRGGYRIEAVTDPRIWDGHPCFLAPPAAGERWFLYPSPSDSWSKPLGKLLLRQDLGSSWLGHSRAARWHIGVGHQIKKPASLTFGAPEVYLFAPTLLPAAPIGSEALLSTQHPTPDASQADAIRMALASTVSCIQGPPGTGKSQTIAALIDEFMLRRKGKSARVLVTAFSYPAMRVVLDKVRESRDASKQSTAAGSASLVWMRSEGREPIADAPGLAHVTDVVPVRSGVSFTADIDGVRLNKKDPKQKRLDILLGDRFVMFVNAYSLVKLGSPSGAKSFEYDLLSNGFGFDLIIIDEASQVPVSQLLASLALVRPQPMTVGFPDGEIPDAHWPLKDTAVLSSMKVTSTIDADALTRVVIVGDDNQLPPVQPIEPPEKLRVVLDSAFGYFVSGHKVPFRQLQRNYRSKQTIVDYTRRLGIYSAGLQAFRADVPYPALPKPPVSSAEWLRRVLDDGVDVSTIIHATQHETAVSPLEAKLAAEMCVAFFEQMGVCDEVQERKFWSEEIGIVSPHNAQGRLVTRTIYESLTRPEARRSTLGDEELMRCLRGTIYSVEKFQGSDRTFILGTVAISSRDQLASEEAFIYDLNRFNVLTSRAKQKMVLLCSKAFLDYIPKDREVFKNAARVRDFAYGFCDRNERFPVTDPAGRDTEINWRYRL